MKFPFREWVKHTHLHVWVNLVVKINDDDYNNTYFDYPPKDYVDSVVEEMESF